jgi:hypothetical protein
MLRADLCVDFCRTDDYAQLGSARASNDKDAASVAIAAFVSGRLNAVYSLSPAASISIHHSVEADSDNTPYRSPKRAGDSEIDAGAVLQNGIDRPIREPYRSGIFDSLHLFRLGFFGSLGHSIDRFRRNNRRPIAFQKS